MEDIRIGFDVSCGSDRVGKVARLIADASDSHISDIVVDRGILHGAKVIPLGQIADVQAETVQLTLDRHQFEEADGFADQRFSNAGDDWPAPPGYASTDFLLDVATASGSGAGYGAGPGLSHYLPGPTDPRPNLLRPVVEDGTPIVSVEGEKVGEVSALGFHPDDGRLAVVTMKWGLLGHERADLPLEWIGDLASDGVALNVDADEVRRWRDHH